MADASHLERMGRELKCPICLSLFSSAVSLTCNHVFCNSCIQKSMKSDSSCPVCKVPFTRREVRPAPHMENLVHIYKGMEIASGIKMFVTQNAAPTQSSDDERQAEGGSNTGNTKCSRTERAVNRGKLSRKTSKSKSILKNSGTKTVRPSFCANKRVQVPKSPLPEALIHLVNSEPEGEAMNFVPDSEVSNDCTSLKGNSNRLGPLFWLREEDADKSSQSADLDHITLTPVDIPTFSDIKDSDDDIPDEVASTDEARRKHGAAGLSDSDMFEWTQRAWSPELCSTPIRIQVPSGDDDRKPDKALGASSEVATRGRLIIENCEKLNSPDTSYEKNGSDFQGSEMKILSKPNGCGTLCKRTRNGRIRSLSKRTKKSEEKDVTADLVHGFVSAQGFGPNSNLNKLVEELPNQVDEKLPSQLHTSSCIKQDNASVITLRNRVNSKRNQYQRQTQLVSRLQKSDFLKLDPIKEVTLSQQQGCDGRMPELHKLYTEALGGKESSIRVDSACSAGRRKSRKCVQELECKRKKHVSTDIGLINTQAAVNVDIHAVSADPTGPRYSAKAGNVVRKCQSNSDRSICGFCHSAEETKLSGEMINYFQGKPVSSDSVGGFGTIHSHKSCAEWAPNVYFQDDIAVNLEAELTRSRRIKCSLCGVKGASLGCYDKSCRRSFHVPCAKRLKQSRWDTDNFVMLCPLHASSKLPNEQSESHVKRKNNSKSTQFQAAMNHGTHTSLWDSSGCSDKLHLCCSALTTEEKEIVTKFQRLSGASVSKNWNTRITHVIASADENGACKRTLKVLMGILDGKWILSIEWVKACLKARKVLDESIYEINVDTHGIKGGPRLGRLRLENKQPKIFAGLKFYLIGDFEPSYKGHLHDLIMSAGGTILHRKPIPEDQGRLPRDDSLPSSTIIVYSLELTDKNDINKDVILNLRQVEAEALGKASRSIAASNLWVLNCISGQKLQPLQCIMI